MGRNKLKIQKLERTEQKQVTYSKRKSGILKKAKELSILCDTDVLLVSFSTTGKTSICIGENSNFDEIVEKYASQSPQERSKRQQEGLEGLKRNFKKAGDHEIDVGQLLNQGSQKVEDLRNQVEMLKKEINDAYASLGPLVRMTGVENVEDLAIVSEMEQNIKSMIVQNQIEMQRHHAANYIDPRCTNGGLDKQLNQNSELLLANFSVGQQIPPPLNSIYHQSSLNAGQHAVLQDQKGLLPQENIGQVLAGLFPGGINAPTNHFAGNQSQTNNSREIQHTVPHNNGEFLLLPTELISDKDYVNNLVEQNIFTFDAQNKDSNLNTDMSLNHNPDPNLATNDMDFNAWASRNN